MKVKYGSIWKENGIKCIPTNGVVKHNGELVMGAGLALQAKLEYPNLPFEAGALVKSEGNHVFYFPHYQIITVPTKDHYKDKSRLTFVKTSIMMLAGLANEQKLENIIVPALGCGLGGLELKEVQPIMEKWLDDRFTLVI